MSDYEQFCEKISQYTRTRDTALLPYFTDHPKECSIWLRRVLTSGDKDNIAFVFITYSDLIGAMLPELKPCIGFEHRSIYHKHNVYEHILAVVDGCHTRDFTIKMAALLHDIGKPHVYTTDEKGYRHFKGHAAESVRIAESLLTRLGIAGKEKATILSLIECHDMELAPSKKSVKRAMKEYGADFIRKWAILRKADRDDHIFPYGTNTRFYTDIDGILAILDEIEAEEKRFKVTDLAISGYDLMELGMQKGKAIGDLLDVLCDDVTSGRVENKREILLITARKYLHEYK